MRLRAKCTPLPAHFALSTSSALSFFLTATPQSSFGCLKFSASHSGGEVLTSSVLLPLAVCLLRYRTERSSPSHQEKNNEKWIWKKMEMLFSCWLLSNYTKACPMLLFFFILLLPPALWMAFPSLSYFLIPCPIALLKSHTITISKQNRVEIRHKK